MTRFIARVSMMCSKEIGQFTQRRWVQDALKDDEVRKVMQRSSGWDPVWRVMECR